uniref:PH domain-containing protein n=1 Tax=Romanomermis culicivorax TaxID=13658 RepID=A0A915J9Z4_ROMCU
MTSKMAMLANGTVVGDGSWVLNVFITDLEVAMQFRVKGDMHIGGVMLKIVQDLDVSRDWSDHALWWPERNRWLTHTRSTLDQAYVTVVDRFFRYGVSAEALLNFTPMHKNVRIQLPDLQSIVKRVDFSVPVFKSVVQVCKEIGNEYYFLLTNISVLYIFCPFFKFLGIRYSEELSFKRFIPPDVLSKGASFGASETARDASSANALVNKNIAQSQSVQHLDSTTINIATGKMPIYNSSINLAGGRTGSLPNTPNHKGVKSKNLDHTKTLPLNRGSLPRSAAMHQIKASSSFENGVNNLFDQQKSIDQESNYYQNFVNSPKTSVSTLNLAANVTIKPKNFAQKAALNAAWLDSSRSLAEQGIGEDDLILLRFKFLSFFDLNPKYDAVRINQLYEQAKWALLMEEHDYTEEEAFMFAALQVSTARKYSLHLWNFIFQLQVQLKGQLKRGGESEKELDDVDVLLNELENTLETSASKSQTDITAVPELADYLKFFKPKKFTLKGWRRAYFTFKDLTIRWFNSREDTALPTGNELHLKGVEVSNDVNLSEGKFTIKLLIPSIEGMTEFWIRCDTEDQYVKWFSGFKLATKGKTMADVCFGHEIEAVRRLLAMQHPAPVSSSNTILRNGAAKNGRLISAILTVSPQDFNPEELLPSRYIKKLRSRQYMVQRIMEAHTNVNELNLTDAKLEFIKAWQALPEYGHHYFVVRFRGSKKQELFSVTYNKIARMCLENGETLKTWRFSGVKKWHIQTDEGEIEFSCLSADCKIVHEFIGGYIFLSLRSKDQNHVLNEELFHQLTGGWQ